MKRIDVAIAVVYRGQKVLICRRRAQDHLGGFWELPGGKVEPGESLEQCVLRELREELDIAAKVISPLPVIEHDYPDRQVRLHPFICEHTNGEPTPIGCEAVQWVDHSTIRGFQFPPANDALIETIASFLASREQAATTTPS